MPERFGGEYSPDNSRRETPHGGRPSPVPMHWRSGLLFFAPLPFLLTAFTSGPAGLLRDLAGFGILILAAWLTREGEKAEAAYAARKVARRPAIPRKIFGSVLTGAGLFVGSMAAGAGLTAPLMLGVAGGVLHFLAFGPDPLADKGTDGAGAFDHDRAARAVSEAEAELARMAAAIRTTGERPLIEKVDGFLRAARALFQSVEDDPRDLTAARRYIGVYVSGAREATEKFANLWTRNKDAAARTTYEALLSDLETNFAQRTTALMSNDRSDLDVEIEVLRDRLAQESAAIGGRDKQGV